MNKMPLRTALQGPRARLIWLFTELSQPVVRLLTTNCEESLPFESLLVCYLFDLNAKSVESVSAQSYPVHNDKTVL